MEPPEAERGQFFARAHKPVIGMVHFLPLPGSEDYRGGGLGPILERALAEARTLAAGGVDAILLQNSGDLPPAPEGEPETIAYMSVIGAALRREVECPLGMNVLANGAIAALAVADAIEAAFVRIKVYVGAVVATEGLLTGAARIADRTSAPLGEMPIAVAADLALRHGHVDALIVTGYSVEDSLARIRAIKAELPGAVVLVGGGATVDNVGQFPECGDGVVVGSSVKDTGHFVGTVDPARLAAFMDAVAVARGSR